MKIMGSIRSNILRNNILFSGILKVVAMCCAFLIVPVTLGYLKNDVYGIWLTISSMLAWFTFFDIGLGNGLRNYLAISISEGDFKKGQMYLSTTITILSSIALLLMLICSVTIYIVNPNVIFNSDSVDATTLRTAMYIAVFATLILFVAKIVGIVFIAMQRYALNDLMNTVGSVVAMLIIYILTKTTDSNLLYVVSAFTITPVIVFFLGAIPLFRKYPQLKPQLSMVDFGYAKTVLSKSMGFFFIQITSCLVIFGASNFFITQFCGPSSVTIYNIAYKYFHLVAIAYGVVLAPIWNAYTDAFVKRDNYWIKSMLRRTLIFWLFSVIACLIMLFFCDWFYSLWIGNQITVPFNVSLAVMLYIIFFNLNCCATTLINGSNKIRIQIYVSGLVTILYVAIVALFGKRYGMVSVVYSMAFCYAIMSLVHLYQCFLIVNKKTVGVWDK